MFLSIRKYIEILLLLSLVDLESIFLIKLLILMFGLRVSELLETLLLIKSLLIIVMF